jgi:AhpD family alkylhydroperoxidase
LEAHQKLSAISARGEPNPAENAAVPITPAAMHGCVFCIAGHTNVACRKIGLGENMRPAQHGQVARPNLHGDLQRLSPGYQVAM